MKVALLVLCAASSGYVLSVCLYGLFFWNTAMYKAGKKLVGTPQFDDFMDDYSLTPSSALWIPHLIRSYRRWVKGIQGGGVA